MEERSNAAIIYIALNDSVENISRMVYLILKVSAIVMMIPAALLTIVNYFIFDLGNGSYFLIARVTSVKITTDFINLSYAI